VATELGLKVTWFDFGCNWDTRLSWNGCIAMLLGHGVRTDGTEFGGYENRMEAFDVDMGFWA
jgi:hypothetical protein